MTEFVRATETVDLSNCDREPIHIPGSIQPHGCLLACDAGGGVVLRHSQNAAEMLGVSGAVNGSTLDDLLGRKAAHDLRNALSTSDSAARPALTFGLTLENGRVFDVSAHRHKAISIIEFEPAGSGRQPLNLTRQMTGRISRIDDIAKLIDMAARLTRGMLGYDRVMIYRFEEDGSGKVVSEVKRGDLESFLGQYFPASDIPQQARALYMLNTIRVISDASCTRVPVEPAFDASAEPLDLSYAHLRSVSPIHCEYLRNMGVAASMSISIIIDGKLWGLIACHHYSPRILPMAERVAAEMFGEFLSLHLHALKQKRRLDTANEARRSLDRFLRRASHHGDVEGLLRDNLAEFRQLVPCDGVGLWMNGRWYGHGTTPPPAAMQALVRFVGTVADGKVWGTNALSQRLPEAEDYAAEAAGVLVVPLSQIPNDYLIFFRRELVQTLNWAGNPDKSYETGPLGDRLTPRKSFAIWKETVRLQAQPWTDADREIAEAARTTMVEIVLRYSELMAEERSKADVRQRMLNEELNHRVKNILAVIKSLIGHPVDEGRSLADYIASLRGRIQALGFAHDQVVRGDGGGRLADLVQAELTPYGGASGQIHAEGPSVWLDGRAFSVMALVLHELATNAAKYGALSAPGGRLSVTWSLMADGDCEILWTERGGPKVAPPSREGFGSALVNRSVPYDLGGKSEMNYHPDGVQARIVLPARHLSAVDAALVDATLAAEARSPAGAFPADLAVLLVEDQMLVAMDVEGMLAEAGIGNVTTANSVSEAMARLRNLTPDVAVLDVNLGHETSVPVAEELYSRGVPFVFATGYGDRSMLPERLLAVPVVRKPYDGTALMHAMAQVLHGQMAV